MYARRETHWPPEARWKAEGVDVPENLRKQLLETNGLALFVRCIVLIAAMVPGYCHLDFGRKCALQ